MKPDEFDKKFDDGEDVTHLLDLDSTQRPKQAQKRVNVDFPCGWLSNWTQRHVVLV